VEDLYWPPTKFHLLLSFPKLSQCPVIPEMINT
jgi:hypothetical protein